MSERIYKYFSSDVLSLIFSRSGFCGIKCSLPKNYNDPYELFLGVDLDVAPDLLASYSELISDLPQYPTTCFSKSPIVTPMWAHYANNHSGFVLEFDVEKIHECFKDISLRDVEYKDSPNGVIGLSLERAAVTKKPRHAVWLQQTVLSEAYFSKSTVWSYERECRLVDQHSNTEDVSGSDILFLPDNCIKSIIMGKNASTSIISASKTIAAQRQYEWYQAIIGKSISIPFLSDGDKNVFVFDEKRIVPAQNTCKSCLEPISLDRELCSWCDITDDQRNYAARSNPLRILDHFGLLDDYYKNTNGIDRS